MLSSPGLSFQRPVEEHSRISTEKQQNSSWDILGHFMDDCKEAYAPMEQLIGEHTLSKAEDARSVLSEVHRSLRSTINMWKAGHR